MVVKYLERYMEEDVPEGFYPSNLGELIEKARQTNEKPTLVLDASSAVSLFCIGLDMSCNGQLKSLAKKVKEFVEKIKCLGADLAVVYCGSRDTRDVRHWKEKRLSKIHGIENFFDRLKNGQTARPEHVQLVAAQRVVKHVFSSSSGCRVWTSLGDCVREIVRYCRGRGGIVLLGQDSDYLIYPEMDVYYVSVKSIDLKTLECKVYDVDKLVRHLKIEREDLPLAATLAGNEFVSYFLVRSFHSKLCNVKGNVRDRNKIFQAIAYFIRGLPPSNGNHYSNLPFVAGRISDPKIGESLLKSSLDAYLDRTGSAFSAEEGSEANRVLRVAREKKKNCEFSSVLVSVLEKKEWRSNNDLEDFRDGDVKPAARVARPLRKKIYGILLRDEEESTVLEYCVEGAKRKKEYVVEGIPSEAELPRSEHPGLLTLWTDVSPETEAVKRKLFFEAVDPDLEADDAAWIPPKLIFPVAALRYLTRGSGTEFFRDEREAEAFLATALKAVETSAEELEKIIADPPPPRAVRLSSVFLRCCATLEVLNEACGFVVSPFDSCPSNYFDGKLFQCFYKRFLSGDNYRDILECDTSLSIMFRTLSDLIHNKNKES